MRRNANYYVLNKMLNLKSQLSSHSKIKINMIPVNLQDSTVPRMPELFTYFLYSLFNEVP